MSVELFYKSHASGKSSSKTKVVPITKTDTWQFKSTSKNKKLTSHKFATLPDTHTTNQPKLQRMHWLQKQGDISKKALGNSWWMGFCS